VLENKFATIDLLEPCEQFLKTAESAMKIAGAGTFLNIGLQEWEAPTAIYDCIWVQWVLAHLTEDDLAVFLKKARDALTETGAIVIKENVVLSGFIVYREDSSVTRSRDLYLAAFEEARLKVVYVGC
jgi:hypothetical protein